MGDVTHAAEQLMSTGLLVRIVHERVAAPRARRP